jgi:PKD repeat protein
MYQTQVKNCGYSHGFKKTLFFDIIKNVIGDLEIKREVACMRKQLFFAAMIFFLGFHCFHFGQGIRIADDLELNERIIPPYAVGTGQPVFEKTFSGGSYIAVWFKDFNLEPGDRVVIANDDGSLIQNLDYRDKQVGPAEKPARINHFCSRIFKGHSVTLTFYVENPESRSSFIIEKICMGFHQEEIDRIFMEMGMRTNCGADDKKWAKCYSGTMYEEARAISRLYINGNSACTGWLLGSEGHLVTNNHCISTPETANNTEYEFDAEGETCETDCSEVFACLGPTEAVSAELIKTDATLDYTLLRLPVNLTAKYGYMQIRETGGIVGEQIYIPQHPGAKGKQLAVEDDQSSTGLGKISGTSGVNLQYMTDTEAGSSGSPVLSTSDNLVVALHHLGGCPNGGVNIALIANHLGGLLPKDAIGFSSIFNVDYFFNYETDIKTVSFVDKSTPIGGISKWQWNFGDGTSSTLQHPSHTFSQFGTYSVTLAITNKATPPETISITKPVRVADAICTNYCTAKATNSTYEFIDSITIGSLTHQSGNNSGYANFTDKVLEVSRGGTYPIALTPGFPNDPANEHFRIWIDLNNDCDFDDLGELVFDASKPSNTTVTGSVFIPNNAANAITMMRIAMRFSLAPGQCETFNFGEVEDYSVKIVSDCPTPQIGYDYSVNQCQVNFMDISTGSHPIVNRQWNFGDSHTSTLANPQHSYGGNGNYSVTLTVTNSCGKSATLTKSVAITDCSTVPAENHLIGLFPQIGIWVRNSQTSQWLQLSKQQADVVRVGDINGNGTDDSGYLFKSINQFWLRYDNSQWEKLAAKADTMICFDVGDMNNDNHADLIGSWDIGLWWRNSVSGVWTKLSNMSPSYLTCGDFDGDGKSDLVGLFPSLNEIWLRYNNGNWVRISKQTNLQDLRSGDLDQDGNDEIIGSWDIGVWAMDPITNAWTRHHKDPAMEIAIGDIDGDNYADIVGVWTAYPGLWMKSIATSTWIKLSAMIPDSIDIGKVL